MCVEIRVQVREAMAEVLLLEVRCECECEWNAVSECMLRVVWK